MNKIIILVAAVVAYSSCKVYIVTPPTRGGYYYGPRMPPSYRITSSTTADISTIQKSRTSGVKTNDYLHEIAKDFVAEVGDRLKKAGGPIAIMDIIPILSIRNGQPSLSYTAEFNFAKFKNKDYFIEHAGSLRIEKTQDSAVAKARRYAYQQYQVRSTKFHKAYGQSNVRRIHHSTETIFYNGEYWALDEYFIIAKKP